MTDLTKHPSDRQTDTARGDALFELENLQVWFPVRAGAFGGSSGHVRAVDDVSFTLRSGETLGLVGESGCGKTTLARTLIRLTDPTGGVLRFRGEDITRTKNKKLRSFRRQVQMVFQDPQSSLNPRKRISQIVGAGFKLRKGEAAGRAGDDVPTLLARVGLDPESAARFPHEFSGGQRQRIGIARALAADPQLIILDEPVSALDVSVQAQVVNLLDDLQDEFGLSYIFVAHDLSVVRHVSDRIAVMYLGKIVELSPADALYARPRHPYTANLLSAIPLPDPDMVDRDRVRVAPGELPSPVNPPPGCRFNTRCQYSTDICREIEPPLALFPDGDLAACHHPLNATQADLAAAVRSPQSPKDSGAELTLSMPVEHEVTIEQAEAYADTSVHDPIPTRPDL